MDLIHNTFDAGLLSPEMSGRSDLPQYYRGCRLLENFVAKPTGGATLRPGFEKIAEVHDSDDITRVVGFVNKTDRYVLEFSDLTMRVYHDGALVTSGASAYELTTPWSSDDVADLVFAPRGQAIFHPNHDIYELACAGDASWTLTAFAAQYGPFLDTNTNTANTITPSGTTGSITLTAAADTFQSGHAGALWEITHPVDEISLTGTFNNTVEPPFTQNETSTTVTIKGPWTVTIHWHGWGKLKLQRSDDGATWKTIRTWDKGIDNSNLVLQDAGDETEDSISFRFYIDWAFEGDPDTLYDSNVLKWLLWKLDPPHCVYGIRAKNTSQTGIVRITNVATARSATATVLNALGATSATDTWREGAWSGVRGFPACGTIHESRIYAARTAYQPTTVWAGRPFLRRADARLMYAGTTVTDDDAFRRTLDAPDCHALEWLASLWVMLAGSDGNLTKCIGANENNPMTPTQFNAIPQSGMGSGSLQPVMLAGHAIYAGRSAKRVYEMTYSDDARTYNPEDLTRFAETVTGDGIVGWAFQQQPYPILWAVTEDGELIGLSRDKQGDLMAWHRHTTDGTFESVAVIPGSGDDEVWVVVRRTVNGTAKRYVERMKPFGYYSGGDSQRDCFFVDSGTKWDGGAAGTITGIAVAAGTNRVTVTAAGHGFTNGWTVKITDVVGMTNVNDRVYTVADKTTNSFVLKTRDGSAYITGAAFTAYTSGGSVERVTNSVTGLTHLAAATVSALLDGQPATGTVTAAGIYTIGTDDGDYHNTIIVGRSYTGVLSPMRPEVRTVAGTAQGRKKKLTHCGVRLYMSAGGRIGSSAADCEDIDYHTPGRTVGDDVALVTDDEIQDHPGGWSDDGDIYIETDTPLPLTVTAIVFGME